jgi:3-methyl-2-oxobutanoate hydroxymethyltransferase
MYATALVPDMSRTTIRDLHAKYEEGEPLTMLTAYDAPTARLVDESGVDVILVGDSAGHNHLGYDGTLPVTMDEALSNTGAVVRGTADALIIADMPFASYGASMERSVENAARFLKEEGADAVKLETAPGGEVTVELVERLTELGMPVQGHVGLTPQRMNEMGGPVIQGREGRDSAFADELVDTAERLDDAGVFTLVIEGTAEGVARRVTEAVDVPTIGIGAGRYTDGQVLVVNDVIGLDPAPYKLSKQYGDVDSVVREATAEFVQEVRDGEFPTRENAYEPVEDE